MITIPTPLPYYPYPTDTSVPYNFTTFSLKTNLDARWNLMRHGHIIYSGNGSVANISIPADDHYYIVAETIPGYTVYIAPKGIFDATEGTPTQAELFYQRDTSFVIIEGTFPTGEPLEVVIIPSNRSQQPLRSLIRPIQGKISWKSDLLPTDDYLVRINVPSNLTPFSDQFITLHKDRPAVIHPVFHLKHPIEKSPAVEPSQNIPSGQINVSSNMSNFKVQIKSLDRSNEVYNETITGHSHSFNLPEGRYLVNYQAPEGEKSSAKPVEVNVKPFSTQNVYSAYEKGKVESVETIQQPSQQQNGITVVTNATNVRMTLEGRDKIASEKKTVQLSGKSTFIALQKSGEYLLNFEPTPNHQTPEPRVIEFKEGESQTIELIYAPKDLFVLVPAGEAIVGDPFLDNQQNERAAKKVTIPAFEIGVYEVTNQQYAEWLTQAFKEKKVFWHRIMKGYVINAEGSLICKTLEANPLSQILAQRGEVESTFSPLAGKENHPVICVSWYGAEVYCKDRGYRLPTENEWEKAAGWAPSDKAEPIRFKFGFGQNTIDRTWANYKESSQMTGSTKQVLTTPVGFYNGINTLPLRAEDKTQMVTHDAKSPIGAYDMSGNVWEWVADGSANNPKAMKIAKGGCYDSLSDGVRVAERIPIPPDYTDIYTGFRPARDAGVR